MAANQMQKLNLNAFMFLSNKGSSRLLFSINESLWVLQLSLQPVQGTDGLSLAKPNSHFQK